MKKTNLKRFLLLFCMLACVFSMTACGNAQIDTNTAKESVKDNEVAYVENYLKDWAKDMILYLDSNQGEAGTDALIADAEAGITLNDVNSKMYIVNQQGMNVKTIGLYNSWNSTKDELGELKEAVDVNNINVKVSDETSELCTISVKLKFEKRECTFEFVINTDYTLEVELLIHLTQQLRRWESRNEYTYWYGNCIRSSYIHFIHYFSVQVYKRIREQKERTERRHSFCWC